MKRNKLFMPFDEEETLLEFLLHKVDHHFKKIVIVTNKEYRQQIEEISDRCRCSSVFVTLDTYPSNGPLVGIYSGLLSITDDYAFFLAADQPFFSLPLIKYMVTKMDYGYDAVVPKTDKGYEPLCAVYRKSCITPIKQMLEEKELKVSALLNRIQPFIMTTEEIKRYDPGLDSFKNVNTESDYRLFNPKYVP